MNRKSTTERVSLFIYIFKIFRRNLMHSENILKAVTLYKHNTVL